jgi:peptide/nickel transport system ATP-binding protein
LIRSTPRLDDHVERLIAIEGAPPNMLAPPSGCAFRDRCPIAETRCETMPKLAPSRPGGTVACWRASTDAWAAVSEAAPGMLRVV